MHMGKNAHIQRLNQVLRGHFKKNSRAHLPWRNSRDPYRILVSEIMLQQTQVDRVVPFYNAFIKKFPSALALAKAPLGNVLRVWQGLGYNRRAKFLREAAKIIADKGFPETVEGMEALPGVGHYTARAVAAFAYNKPEVFVETNIRTVFFHHCYSSVLQNTAITDAELLPLVGQALKQSKMQPRDFYAAMMDYGAHLKRKGVRLNAKSKHHNKQSKFEGSARQLRGAILRELLVHKATLTVLLHRIPRSREEVARELARLTLEGLVAVRGKYFSISK